MECGNSIKDLENGDSVTVTAIWKASKWNLKDAFKGLPEMDKFIEFLGHELDKLIRIWKYILMNLSEKLRSKREVKTY